jgi:hypothetical protein
MKRWSGALNSRILPWPSRDQTITFLPMPDHVQTGASVPDASSRFERAIRRFDEENAHDVNTEIVDGAAQPRELVHARRLFAWVLRLHPEASEPLRLAARCQHLCRWMIPRSSHPMDRAGYLRWRSELKKFHAARAGEILREVGYADEVVARVQELNLKKNFPADSDSRVLEDALCLVFLEYQFAALAARTAEDKMINALRKSWAKMTPNGQAEALKLSFAPKEKALIEKALKSGAAGPG